MNLPVEAVRSTPLPPGKTNRTEFFFLAAIVLAGAALRVAALLTTINWYNEEPFFYLHDVIDLLTRGASFPVKDNHPSGYQYILAGLVTILRTKDIVAVGRWFSLVCGFLTVVPLYFLVRRNFGALAAGCSCAVFALYDTHILLSVNTMNFAPFYLFFIAGLWALGWRPKTLFLGVKMMPVVLSALFFAVANAIRFESWLFAIPLIVWLGLKKKWREALIFAAISMTYPVVYLFMAHAKWDTYFPFLGIAGGIDISYAGLLDPREVVVWWREFVKALGYAPLAVGLVGLALGLRHRRRELLLCFALVMFFYLFRSMRHRFIFAGQFPRYTVLPLIFFIPYIFLAVQFVARRLNLGGARIAVAFSILVLAVFGAHSYASYRSQVAAWNLADESSPLKGFISWAANNIQWRDRVCMDFDDHPDLANALIEAKGMDAPTFHYPFHPCVEYGADCRATPEMWIALSREALSKNRCNFLVTREDLPFQQALADLTPPPALAASFPPYRVYRLDFR